MNRLVYLLLLVQGLSIVYATPDIPPVILKRTITNNKNELILQWYPVKLDQDIPIIGYKVKVWQAPCVAETVEKVVNGTLVKEVIGIRKKFDPYAIPDNTPLHVYIVPADKLECTVPNILIGVWYHVRVRAFTLSAEGKYSQPHQFALGLNESNDQTCNIVNQTSSSYNYEYEYEEQIDEA